MKRNEYNESGFEDYPEFPRQESRTPCPDRSHDPPGMMVVPRGKRFKHVCPTCGKVSYIYPSGCAFYVHDRRLDKPIVKWKT